MPSRACEGFDEADVLGASSRLGRGVEGCAVRSMGLAVV